MNTPNPADGNVSPLHRRSTTKARLVGGICGSLWMPAIDGGIEFSTDLRDQFDRMAGTGPTTFRDALLHVLMANGGDFQNPKFTGDTRLVVTRTCPDRSDFRRTRTKEWMLSEVTRGDIADLVNNEIYVNDFVGDECAYG